MSEILHQSNALADLHAAAEAADTAAPVDAELVQRIQKRAEEARERIRRQHGLLNISADLIREARDSR